MSASKPRSKQLAILAVSVLLAAAVGGAGVYFYITLLNPDAVTARERPEAVASARPLEVSDEEVPPMADPSGSGNLTAQAAQAEEEDAEEPAPIFPGLPNRDQVRSQARNNPHGAPEAVMDFAADMGPIMEQALQSQDTAREAFPKLKTCALTNGATTSIRALCLMNAQRLSVKYGEAFRSDYLKLQSQMPEHVQLIAKTIGFYGDEDHE